MTLYPMLCGPCASLTPLGAHTSLWVNGLSTSLVAGHSEEQQGPHPSG